MSEPRNTFPPEFWRSLSDEERDEIFETGVLNRKLCARLYRMTDRHDEPPDEITPLFYRPDVERWLKSLKKKKKPRVKGRP